MRGYEKLQTGRSILNYGKFCWEKQKNSFKYVLKVKKIGSFPSLTFYRLTGIINNIIKNGGIGSIGLSEIYVFGR